MSRCPNCGHELAADHRFCPRCGIARPAPKATPQPDTRSRLRWLPFVFAAGAVFWLIELAQLAAVIAAPAGREQLLQAMANAGISGETTVLVAFEATILFFFEATAAGLHAAAYFGLRRFKPWGWIAALIVSAAWSLILVGIPVLVLLLRRPTREAYGIS